LLLLLLQRFGKKQKLRKKNQLLMDDGRFCWKKIRPVGENAGELCVTYRGPVLWAWVIKVRFKIDRKR
jgi:hypothetical protein